MGNIKHLFCKEENFLLTYATGVVTDDLFKDFVMTVFKSDKISEGYRALIDARTVSTQNTPTSELLFELAHSQGGERHRKVAVVVDSDVIYGLVRMWGAYNNNADLEVFRDFEKAVKWLELESESGKITEFFGSCDPIAV